MGKTENNVVRERSVELSPSTAVAEQIQRALDMMKRVRAVNATQAEKALQEPDGNKYILPEPVVFRISQAS